jgi:hypothetical protein
VSEGKAEMSELRDKVAGIIATATHRLPPLEPEYGMADDILALPEIANGLQLLEMRKDEMIYGTGCVRITRIAPEDVRIDPSA